MIKPKSRLVCFMDAIWRTLILPYPAEFRTEYGTEMVRAFRDLFRSMRAQRGMKGVVMFWFDALTDILKTAPAEHIGVLLRDLRSAFRIVRQQPAARKAIVAVALGIGCAAFGYGESLCLDHQSSFLPGGAPGALFRAFSGLSLYFLVACANVASFLLVEAVSRQENTSLRGALEADRCKVTRQLRIEGIVISVLGGIMGLFLVSFATSGLAAMIAGDLKAVAINPAVLGFIVLLFTLISAFLQGRGVKITLSEIQHGCTTQLPLDRRRIEIAPLS